MIDGLDAQVRADAEATHITDAACITVHAALDASRCNSAPATRVDAVMVELLPTSYETLRRDFDELRYGQFMPYPLLGLGSLSQFDPSARAGGQGHPAPVGLRALRAPRRPQLGRQQARLRRSHAGAPGEVRREHAGRACCRPMSTARSTWSAPRPASAAATCTASPPPPTSSGAHRPTPELGQYTVPGLERFYLVGPVPASRRRRVRRRARHGDEDVRGAGHRLRQAGPREVKLQSTDGSELMTVTALERDGNTLVIKGKVFGAMPMNAQLDARCRARGAEAADAAADLLPAHAAVSPRLSASEAS